MVRSDWRARPDLPKPDPVMVELNEVSKYYGDKRALGPVTFEVPRGQTVGVLGLNGVGKTTMLRILSCALRPSAGRVTIDGIDALEHPHEVRKRVGYLPERPPVYPDMTVGDYLAFAGRIRGLTASEVDRRIPAVEERTHLTGVHDEIVRNLSQGFRQRVGVAQAIIHDPALLILDEPTHDLDPVQIREMREMIRDLGSSHTILVSSHILSEISRTCDRVLILDAGTVVASGTEEELSARMLGAGGMVVEVGISSTDAVPEESPAPESSVRSLIESVPGVERVDLAARSPESMAFEVDGVGDLRAPVCRVLVEAGHDVLRLDRTQGELENMFVELVGEASN